MSKREIKVLEAHWSRALDVAARAAQDGREAHTLPATFCTLELAHIQAERQWLKHYLQALG